MALTVLFGQAAAPIAVFAISGAFDDNLRTAFLIVTPPVFIGAFLLLRAREHLEADAARIFEAIVTAVQEQQARAAEAQTRAQADATGAEPPSPWPPPAP